MATTVELPLYVLVGGASRRFGADKASHPRYGVPWALHVGKSLSAGHENAQAQNSAEIPSFFVPEIVLVGNLSDTAETDPKLASLRRISDAVERAGPFGGLLAAVKDRLAEHGDGLLAIASCDLVDPEPSWLYPLVNSHSANRSLEVAAYSDQPTADDSSKKGPRWQPFPSLAHTRWARTLFAFAETNTVAESQDYSLQRLYQKSIHQRVAWQQKSMTAISTTAPPQANTRSELEKLSGESP